MKTKGDTEVLVHAYEEHGTRFPEWLRGMYAVALWDANHQRLVLARDRLGKKPLYWRLAYGRLTYGSELKALLADPTTPTDRSGGARVVSPNISTFRRLGPSSGMYTSCRPRPCSSGKALSHTSADTGFRTLSRSRPAIRARLECLADSS